MRLDGYIPTAVGAAYGPVVGRIVPVRGVWSAEAYALDTSEGQFFLKVYDKRRPSVQPWIRRMDIYLPLMVRLSQSPEFGFHLPRLRLLPDGRDRLETDEEIFLLFDYIPGHTLEQSPLTQGQAAELAGILAGLHDFPTDDLVGNQALAEDLSLPFRKVLAEAFTRTSHLPEPLKKILSPHAARLSAALDFTVRLNAFRRESHPRLVLGHNDAHRGNLMQSEHLILLDWEGLSLVPAEADLFMLVDEPHFPDFMREYTRRRPGFVLNDKLLYYYCFHRRMIDVFEFIVQLLYDRPEPETAETALARLAREVAEIGPPLEEYGEETVKVFDGNL